MLLKQTDEFNQIFASDQRTLAIRVTVADKTYTSDDLISVEYDSAAMTGEQMGLGSTYENAVKISFANLVEGIKAKDKVTVEVGTQLSNGEIEYASLGVFYVTDEIEMDRNNNLTNITADDGMCMLEGAYKPSVAVGVTLAEMVVDIANQAGVKVNDDNISSLPQVNLGALPKEQTYRTVLGWLAMMIPGYVTFDRDGLLCLKGLNGSTYRVDPNNYEFQGLTKNENPYTLDGITVTQNVDTDSTTTDETSATVDISAVESTENTLHVGETTGSQLTIQNDLMSQEQLDVVWLAVKEIQYYPYTLNWFGNPAVEAGDWLQVSDTQGNQFTVPNNSYTLTFDGGLSAVSSTAETASSSTDFNYQGALEQTVKNIMRKYNASGTFTYYTASDPVDPHDGDLWYKPDGKSTELYIYSKGVWSAVASDVTGNLISAEVDTAQQDILAARGVADEAHQQAQDNADAILLKVGNDEYNSTIAELNNDINLRVTKDDLISQINIEAGQTLIESGKILLDAPTVTFSGEAFIPSAAIKDLEANKITAGTIDASVVDLINLNASNISTGTLDANTIEAGSITGDKLDVNAIQVGLNAMGSSIKIDPLSLNFYDGNGQVLALDQAGLNIWQTGANIGRIHGNVFVNNSQMRGLNFDLNAAGDFMAWGARDNDDENYVVKLAWYRQSVASALGVAPGFVFDDNVQCKYDVTMYGAVTLNGFQSPDGPAVKLGSYSVNGDTGASLLSEGGYGVVLGNSDLYFIDAGGAHSASELASSIATASDNLVSYSNSVNDTLGKWQNSLDSLQDQINSLNQQIAYLQS